MAAEDTLTGNTGEDDSSEAESDTFDFDDQQRESYQSTSQVSRDALQLLLEADDDSSDDIPIHLNKQETLTDILLREFSNGDAIPVDAGFQLIKEGATGTSCYLILPLEQEEQEEGSVKVRKTVFHPEKTITVPLANLTPPCVVGEISPIASGERTASVVTSEPVKVIEIPIEKLGAVLEQHPDLKEEIEDLARKRLKQQIKSVSKAENKILRVLNKEERQKMELAFDFEDAHAAVRQENGQVNRETVLIKPRSAEGEMPTQIPLTITAEPATQTALQREVEPVGFIANIRRRLSRSSTTVMTPQTVPMPGSVKFLVKHDGNVIFSFSKSNKGADLHIDKASTDKAGIGGQGIVSQLYRAAFKGVDKISTTWIEEPQTLEYFSDREIEHHFNDTIYAPSSVAAYSPVVAARKGYLSVVNQTTDSQVHLDSYKIDDELDEIFYTLKNIERRIIGYNLEQERINFPDAESPYEDAGLSAEKFEKLYPDWGMREILDNEEVELREYIAKDSANIDGTDKEYIVYQFDRIEELRIIIDKMETE